MFSYKKYTVSIDNYVYTAIRLDTILAKRKFILFHGEVTLTRINRRIKIIWR